jgi:superfamily II helicase
MCKVTKFYKIFYIRKTIEFKKEKIATRHALEGVKERLQNNTQYTSLQQVVRKLKDKVRVLEHVKVEGTRIWSRTRWMDKRNWCSKEFF